MPENESFDQELEDLIKKGLFLDHPKNVMKNSGLIGKNLG